MLIVLALCLVVGGFVFVQSQSKPSLKAGGSELVACLGCGNFTQTPSREGAITRCAECGAYARVAAGPSLAPIEPEFIAPDHVFKTFLPEAPRWPDCCCVCCGPATARVPMSITYAAEATMEEKMTTSAVVAVASAGMVRVASQHVNVTERYKVPHCAEHVNGVRLDPAGVAFRSYRYFRQFVDANRANVGS